MKKIVCTFVILIIIVSLSLNTMAVETVPSLLDIANEHIVIAICDEEIVYMNLDGFIATVRENLSDTSDLTLAEFIIEYTGLFYEGADDTEKLEVLDFTEIRSTTQLYQADQEGNLNLLDNGDVFECNGSSVYESEDGYLKIVTQTAAGSKIGNDTQYVLFANAEWVKMPAFRLKDTFAITYGGVFDDSYNIIARLIHEETCLTCGNTTSRTETEKFGPDTNGVSKLLEDSSRMELDYSQNNAIGVKFGIWKLGCGKSECESLATNSSELYVTLKFRVLVSSTTEAKAAYAHKKVGADITIGAELDDDSIKPVFSATLVTQFSEYIAAPVTLRVT